MAMRIIATGGLLGAYGAVAIALRFADATIAAWVLFGAAAGLLPVMSWDLYRAECARASTRPSASISLEDGLTADDMPTAPTALVWAPPLEVTDKTPLFYNRDSAGHSANQV